jgi:hypothetical protein
LANTLFVAFLWLLIQLFTIGDDGILAKQWVRLSGVARLEHGKSVFQLTDAIAHTCDPAVQVLSSGNDEANDNVRSPVRIV